MKYRKTRLADIRSDCESIVASGRREEIEYNILLWEFWALIGGWLLNKSTLLLLRGGHLYAR